MSYNSLSIAKLAELGSRMNRLEKRITRLEGLLYFIIVAVLGTAGVRAIW